MTTVQETSRRRVVAGAIAAVAALAGAAWVRGRRGEAPLFGQEQAGEFWTLEFDPPGAGDLVRPQLFRGQPLLVNFWATWCPPCVEEMPLLNRFYTENRSNGWQLLGLAVDQKSAVQRYLRRSPVDFPVGLASENGVDLMRQLGNSQQALPFSVLFAADGALRQRQVGQLSARTLSGWRRAL
jgi:thiol-disulfide isomerase/thioredoxin